MKKEREYRLAKGNGILDIKNFEQVGSFWSRDDEFVDFVSNKDQFGMVIDQHDVTFICIPPANLTPSAMAGFFMLFKQNMCLN